MYYNKDLIKTAPKTFKDLEALAKNPKYAYANDKTKTSGSFANGQISMTLTA